MDIRCDGELRAGFGAGSHVHIEQLPCAAILRQGDLLHLNRGARALIGYRGDAPLPVSMWFSQCFGGAAQAQLARYEADQAAGFPVVREWTLCAHGGRWCEVEMLASHTETGELWLLHDISARVAAARALVESEARFRDLADASGDFIVEVDFSGRFTFLSDNARNVLGYAAEEMVGRKPVDFMPAGEAARVREWIDRHMDGEGRIRELEHRFVKPSGEEIWVSVSANPIRDAQGRRIGQRGIGRDVTQSRREAEAVASNEAQLRLLLECAQDGIFLNDAQGRYFYANPSGLAMVGYTASELNALHARDLLAASECARLPGLLQRLESAARVRDEWSLRRKDGSAFPAEISGQRLPDGAYLSLVRDISERRRAEGAIREMNAILEQRVSERTAELERINRELEAFSYSVSHDLRAPLRAINGFSQILAETERERLSEDSRMLLDRVVHNTNKMGKLIEDILAYSRAGRLPLQRVSVKLDEVAASVVAELADQFPSARLTVSQLPVVLGDEAMLRQVFANLVHNAFKFSSRQPTPMIEISSRRSDGVHVIKVRDNGAGFDMGYADKLFGMFQRMHGETAFPGTGVGLAIVKRLVERHGGSVSASAAPGAGAEFRVSLPAFDVA